MLRLLLGRLSVSERPTEAATSIANVNDRLHAEENHLQRDRVATGNSRLPQDHPRHPTGTATATSLEHHQQVRPAGAILPQPFLHQPVQLARLHRLLLSRVEAIQHLLHLPGHEVAVAAALGTSRAAISLALHRAVAHGVVDLAEVVSTVVAVLRPDLVALAAEQLLLRLLSADLVTQQQPHIPAPCASATICPIYQRKFRAVRRLLRFMTRAGFSSSRKMLGGLGR